MIYFDNYQDSDVALEYYTKVKAIGIEYNLLSGELLGLIKYRNGFL